MANQVKLISPQYEWQVYRSEVASTGDTALTATTKKWADRPLANMFDIPTEFYNLEIRFRATDASATASYVVYLYANADDAVKVCSGTLAFGDQTATDGGVYADNISVTSVWGNDIVSFDTGAADGMGRIAFDAVGYDYIYVELTSISAGDTVSVDIRGV